MRIAIAHTEPTYRGRSAICEVEQLNLDAIAVAQRSIYIENQYLTSAAIGDTFARRLDEPDGPEVISWMSPVGKAASHWR